MNVTCTRCHGQVFIPAFPERHVTCPHCQSYLIASDPETGAIWLPRRKPSWSRRIGLLLIAAAVARFYIGFAVMTFHSLPGGDVLEHWRWYFLRGILNPFVLVGVPLGLWLLKRASRAPLAPPPDVSREAPRP